MGQLTDEEYSFFDDYLAVTKNSIEDSNNDVGLKDDQASIKAVKRNSGQSLKRRKTYTEELGTVLRPPGEKTIVHLLRDLCTHIRGSSKQRELFIEARKKTRDPPLLPISIPMMRWNFFSKQIQRAHQLKLLIQIYTNTPQTEEVWSAMEYMEPILHMFNQACNVFQSKAPSKHLVLPYYQVILNRLTHYASKSPHSWRQACEGAHAKLKKYYDCEMANNNSLIATLLNMKNHEGIFKQMGVTPHRAKEVIDILACECSTMAQNEQSGPVTGDQQSSSDNLSEPESFDLLKHLKQPPIEKMYDVLHSHDDEVILYLQNTHPMTKGKHMMDFWKSQIIARNFPNLGKVALRYLSIPASLASVERVFSHSG
ncbi:hypothetical protein O181_082003 [Austropuccinia psidii MF-1]|uniref:HAT C-terminal dimerisation domain-containing protein n=1 Tax=Austropuccinia psidii MF-1 TaxID=1389203 RepID=A0A9Q3II22_9BASI|nr:hypothetical protein [Austropuccinia psidii MF-1]